MKTVMLLFLRSLLFLIAQAATAVVLSAQGWVHPFQEARRYWILYPLFANAVVFIMMMSDRKKKRADMSDLWGKFQPLAKKEILEIAGMLALACALATLPNMAFLWLLWGSQEAVDKILFPGVPLFVGWVAASLPLSQAFCEIPYYYGYCHERMKGKAKLYRIAACLAFQHVFLPAVLDPRYVVWRIASFALISVAYGLVFLKRPRLRPYVLLSHGMLDLPVVLMSVA